MSHKFRVGELVEFGLAHMRQRAKVLECSYANEVVIDSGTPLRPRKVKLGSDRGPVYRIGVSDSRRDDDTDEYDWWDWFRESEITKVNILDHMVNELNRAELLNYVEGDATRPQGDGPKLILHICNNIGAWGAGFVLALSRRWPEPEREYRAWHASDRDFGLGRIQQVQVEDDIWVVNMVAQHGIRSPTNPKPIQYFELKKCLQRVAGFASKYGVSVHMPRIGCGLAGGDWKVIEEIIKETLIDGGVKVTVYDFAG
jgi:O-acetyl-ADP-ribose deacetylase (regulator of RNase III)